MSEVSATVTDLRPEVELLVDRLGALFDTVVANAPAFIRLFREVADAVLDIANFVIPIINTLIDVIGEFAQLTAGVFEFLEVNESDPSWAEFLGLDDTMLPAGGPGAAARRLESRGAAPQRVQVDVTGELRDENGEIKGVITDTAQSAVERRRTADSRRARRTNGPSIE
jgi:hypothetical protein